MLLTIIKAIIRLLTGLCLLWLFLPRQADAAKPLVTITVARYGIPHGRPAAFEPPSNHVAMISMPGPSEGVSVPSGTINKEVFFVSLKLPQLVFGQSAIVDGLNKSVLPGTECDLATTVRLRHSEIESVRLLARHKPDTAYTADLVGWRLSSIQNYWSKFESEPSYTALSKLLASSVHDVGSQSSFARLAGVFYLVKNGDNEQKVGNQNARRGGIVDNLVDSPHDQAGISYFVGIFCGAIGIALYLKGRSFIGGALIALALFTPLFPWWLYVLAWSTTP